MESVADQLRRELEKEVRRLSGQERIDLAFRLGEEDLEAFRRHRGLGRDEAIRELQRRRQRGRRPSACMRALVG